MVRIGNAQAFWGDRSDAAAEMLSREPDLDYLTLDYLAEVSMSILATQRDRDPKLGYPRDFIEVVRSLAPYWAAGGRCRLIANAGGLNPRGCAEACRDALEQAGCRALKIAVVTGDDVLDSIRRAPDREAFRNLDTEADVSIVLDRLVTANAYMGAEPIVNALQQGADIVITGRVADPSLTVAPAVHHFGWRFDDWPRLAGATIAGHLIECGTQVTGGISTEWLDVPDPAHIGFPIVEISEDGSCVVTKPRGTGGRVTTWTVKEQLVYEIGDPDNYLSPDVTVSFLGLNVEEIGPDRVRVSGAIGRPAPPRLKVSATYRDGYRSAGTLTIIGRNGAEKAQRAGEIVLQRVQEAGFALRDSIIEVVGSPGNAFPGSLAFSPSTEEFQGKHSLGFLNDVVLRVAIESDTREAAERFTKELMPLITAGPPGTTGYAEGRPAIHPVVRYWPCLIDREIVNANVEMIATRAVERVRSAADHALSLASSAQRGNLPLTASDGLTSNSFPPTLHDFAYARSGDKGTSANIGVLAKNGGAFALLKTWLTAERVAEFLRPLGAEDVQRYELSNLEGFNFVVYGILRRSLRTDAQGKALGQLLLEMPINHV